MNNDLNTSVRTNWSQIPRNQTPGRERCPCYGLPHSPRGQFWCLPTKLIFLDTGHFGCPVPSARGIVLHPTAKPPYGGAKLLEKKIAGNPRQLRENFFQQLPPEQKKGNEKKRESQYHYIYPISRIFPKTLQNALRQDFPVDPGNKSGPKCLQPFSVVHTGTDDWTLMQGPSLF